MTDITCEHCKYVAHYPFLDPCFRCTHHKNFESMGEDKEKKDGSNRT